MLQVHEYNKQPLVTKHYPKGIKPTKQEFSVYKDQMISHSLVPGLTTPTNTLNYCIHLEKIVRMLEC